MSEETARAIVIAVTAIGAVAWMAGLMVMLRATRERQASTREPAAQYDFESEPGAGTISGEADVEGTPDELSTKLAERLARTGFGPFGPVKIVACDRNAVAFEAAGSGLGAAGYGGSGFRSGRVRFTGSGKRTHIDYILDASSRSIVLAFGWLFLALGLLALVTAPWLEFNYVLPDPRMRTQAFQIVQMVHFLWPPFLFAAAVSRQPARMLRAQMEALINNLQYT